MGFLGVQSGPLVRSSYRAGRMYAAALAARGAAPRSHEDFAPA
jgi:lipoic acid synthetase